MVLKTVEEKRGVKSCVPSEERVEAVLNSIPDLLYSVPSWAKPDHDLFIYYCLTCLDSFHGILYESVFEEFIVAISYEPTTGNVLNNTAYDVLFFACRELLLPRLPSHFDSTKWRETSGLDLPKLDWETTLNEILDCVSCDYMESTLKNNKWHGDYKRYENIRTIISYLLLLQQYIAVDKFKHAGVCLGLLDMQVGNPSITLYSCFGVVV